MKCPNCEKNVEVYKKDKKLYCKECNCFIMDSNEDDDENKKVETKNRSKY